MKRKPDIRIAFTLILLLVSGVAAAQKDKVPQAKASRSSQRRIRVCKRRLRGGGSCKYLGSDNLQGLPRGELQQFRKDSPLETTNDTRRASLGRAARAVMARGATTWPAAETRARSSRFKGVSASKVSERCLECTPTERNTANYARSAHKSADISASIATRHIMPRRELPASRNSRSFVRLSPGGQSGFHQGLSSSRQRRPGEVHRLPQSAWWIRKSADALHRRARCGCSMAMSIKQDPSRSSMSG